VSSAHHLSIADLKNLPSAASLDGVRPDCCAALQAPGWESLPAAYDTGRLRLVGTLRTQDSQTEPVLDEYHPDRSRFWSADAPIAPLYFPYNQSDVWQCARCGRPFLRYTENGGYYTEDRIRELDTARVVDAPLP
jgi:hypothetical protein